MTPIEYLLSISDYENDDKSSREYLHKCLNSFGLLKEHHKKQIKNLSGGQKARVKLASFGVYKPHLLVLDEPTNHLDLETIDSLISSLNEFKYAVILVSHNYDVINKINCELYVLDKEKGLYKHEGDYDDYVEKILNELD